MSLPAEVALLPPNGIVAFLLRDMTDYELALARQDVEREWQARKLPEPER